MGMRVLQNPAHLVRMRPARRRSPRPTSRRPHTTCIASIAAAANACTPCERAQPLMPRLWHSSQIPSRSLRARSQSLDGTRAARWLPAFTTTMFAAPRPHRRRGTVEADPFRAWDMSRDAATLGVVQPATDQLSAQQKHDEWRAGSTASSSVAHNDDAARLVALHSPP